MKVDIDASIVRPNHEPGFFPTLEQFAQYCRQTSLNIVKTKGYAGVSIVQIGTTINVFDGSAATSGTAKQINFTDLIGQPTWIKSPNISIKTVMRADLAVGSQIKLPQTVVTNSAQANSSLVNQKTSFQGEFKIISLRHVGNFRQSLGDSWVTVIEAAPNQVAAA